MGSLNSEYIKLQSSKNSPETGFFGSSTQEINSHVIMPTGSKIVKDRLEQWCYKWIQNENKAVLTQDQAITNAQSYAFFALIAKMADLAVEA